MMFLEGDLHDRRADSVYFTDEHGDEHELMVVYDYHEWSQRHPDGGLTMQWRECSRFPLSYHVDGVETTHRRLVEWLGAVRVDNLITEAMTKR